MPDRNTTTARPRTGEARHGGTAQRDGENSSLKRSLTEGAYGERVVYSSDLIQGDGSSAPVAASSLLQPRVAVLLGVSEKWHFLLFLCRLLSVAPAVYWGLPTGLRFLAQIRVLLSAGEGSDLIMCKSCEGKLRPTETLLAIMWCGSSAYLSFFFTDCLMSRWLLNYTPQATLVRLIAINALNGYITSCVFYLAGTFLDARLLLPGWVCIATTLTALYHITQLKINIRKETRLSISVFSLASFISMLALMAQQYLQSASSVPYPAIPAFDLVNRAWEEAGKLAVKMLEYGNLSSEL